MNYLPYLKKKTWSLSEAAGLVSKIFDNNENTRTYQKALKAIKDKVLEADVFEKDFLDGVLRNAYRGGDYL